MQSPKRSFLFAHDSVKGPLVEGKKGNIVMRFDVQLAELWMMFIYDRYRNLRCPINTVNY